MRARSRAGAAVLLLAVAAALPAAEYAIVEAQSNIQFSVPLMVVSKVSGKFMKYDVKIQAGRAADLSEANVSTVIRMDSIDTGNDTWDAKLRTPAWFDAARYPEIRFTSTRVRKGTRGWEVEGELELHGVKKTVTLPFTIEGRFDGPNADEHIGVHSTFRFDRRDYGLGWSGNTEAKAVGNAVTVEITLLGRRVATKAAPAPRPPAAAAKPPKPKA